MQKKDIVILSKYKLTNPRNCFFAKRILSECGELESVRGSVVPCYDKIRFSTVSGFKGLESPVVIFIDVDGFEREEDRLLNYVSISRAAFLLYILYDEKKESERQRMLLKSYFLQ